MTMPNWCSNIVYVSHEDEKLINELIQVCKKTDLGLFNTYVPIPPSEENDWYSWNINNWGTKWDVNSEDLSLIVQGNDRVCISFDTAWGPPIEFFKKIEEQYGFVVKAYAFETGMFFAGIYEDGDFEEYRLDDPDLPEELDEAFCIKDYLKDIEEENNG
jgi:hypothetical protein